MDQKLPTTAASTRLGLILSRWREWDARLSGEPGVERKLGGLSNDNYLVISGERQFVVRLNNDRFDLDVDRRVERRILADIADESFSPVVTWASDDCLVTEFVDGVHPHDPDPAGMGWLFRQIHSTHCKAAPVLDPYLHVERYMGRITRPPESLQICFKKILSNRAPAPQSLCLCHNDLLLENIVVAGSGLVAIDWEYARMGDAAFDMAVFAHTYHLDEAAMARMLAAYGADEGMARRIEHYRDVYALVEICWWLIRGRDIGSLDSEIQALTERLQVS